MNKQLMIIGFHRSGTSMLTQELSNAGLFVGSRLLGPHISNVDGHYEDFDFFSLHEKILNAHNETWQYTSKVSPSIDEKFDKEIEWLLNDRANNHQVWGFKDPTTALFLSQWQKKLDNPYTVVIYRHYEECVNSLLHRNAVQIANKQTVDINFWKDPTLAYRMWLSYNQKIIKHVEENPTNSIVVSHSGIIQGFPIVQTINQKFGFELDTSIKSAIKKELLTSRSFTPYLLATELKEELEETWEKLQSLSFIPSDKLENQIEYTASSSIHDLREVLRNIEISTEKKDVISEIINELNSESIDIKEKIKIINQNRQLFNQFQSNSILIAKILTLVENNPKVFELYFSLSHLYTQLKEFKEAEFYLLKAFTMAEKTFPYFYNKLSDFYIKTNQLVLAKIAIENALKGNPNNPQFYFTYSRLQEKQCRYIEAIEYIDKALGMLNNQNNAEIQFTLYKVNILVLSIKDENKAKFLLDELLEKYPEDKRIVQRKKELLGMNKTIHFDKNKEEERILISLREDKTYFSKIIAILNKLEDGWARDDLVSRMIEYFKLKNKKTEKNTWDTFNQVLKNDYKQLKMLKVQEFEPVIPFGRRKEINEHFRMVEKEFSSKTMLEFYHAWIIINIRRKVNLTENINKFFTLWSEESNFLITELSSRWLVSACDTIIDYSSDKQEQVIALNAVVLVNTIKLYETERMMYS
ncbi:MAG TPA: hypothetical protein ENK66_02405, partial [Arcobacter sp.]|nr:hypothetical protein [Arcobacter sp.]